MKKRQSKARKMLAIFAAFMIAFTALPMMTGDIEASAASAPAKVTKLKVSSVTKNSVKLTWKKPSKKKLKKMSGIVVFRNGKAIKTLGKKKTAFTDTKLKAGTTYTYTVRTYKKSKKKKIYSGVVKVTVKTKGSSSSSSGKGKDSLFANSSLPNKTFNLADPPSSSWGPNSYSFKVKTSKYVIWSSSKPSVAAITPYNDGTEGCLYINSVGTTTITAKNWDGQTKTATITVKNEPVQPEPVQPDPATLVEDTTTYFNFSGVQIHMGQQWTSSLETQLKNKANGTKTYTRSGSNATGGKAEKICMFNTNTYNPFLCVYIVDGRISGWGDNASCLGVIKNQTVNRDAVSTSFGVDTGYGILKFYVGSNKNVRVVEIFKNGHGSTSNSQTERNIGFHYVNAARVAYDKGILQRDKYLEGVDLETGQNLLFTGTIDCYYITVDEYGEETWVSRAFENQRYGAQAWAETMKASGKISHKLKDMTAGPCYDVGDQNVLMNASYLETGITSRLSGENVAGGNGGEMAVFSYAGSVEHCANMFLNVTYIGLGFCDGYHCERYGNRY